LDKEIGTTFAKARRENTSFYISFHSDFKTITCSQLAPGQTHQNNTNHVVYLSGTDVKYNRNDTSSPVPSTLTAGPHGQQAPFMNTHAQLHPFGYAGNLAFYHGGGMIGGFAAPYTTQMYQVRKL
jgi:hypothetical protein